jgi:hypothetical protein
MSIDNDPETDSAYAEIFTGLNRENFQKDKESFREAYLDLIKRIEAASWIESIVREDILCHDYPSSIDRLRGGRIIEHTRLRKIKADSITRTRDLETYKPSVDAAIFFDCFYSGWPGKNQEEILIRAIESSMSQEPKKSPTWNPLPWKWC